MKCTSVCGARKAEVLPLEEKGMLLQGPHHVITSYPAAVSSSKSENNPSISLQESKTLPQFSLGAKQTKWVHDRAQILWQSKNPTIFHSQNYKILIVNNVLRFHGYRSYRVDLEFQRDMFASVRIMHFTIKCYYRGNFRHWSCPNNACDYYIFLDFLKAPQTDYLQT